MQQLRSIQNFGDQSFSRYLPGTFPSFVEFALAAPGYHRWSRMWHCKGLILHGPSFREHQAVWKFWSLDLGGFESLVWLLLAWYNVCRRKSFHCTRPTTVLPVRETLANLKRKMLPFLPQATEEVAVNLAASRSFHTSGFYWLFDEDCLITGTWLMMITVTVGVLCWVNG